MLLTTKFSRWHWCLAVALFSVVVLLGLMTMAPGVVGVFHDDGVYVATAKALAEGKGYRLVDLPGEPTQTKYPFLYPFVLAIIWRMSPAFPDNLVLLQVFSLACTAGSVAVSFLYLVRFGYFTTAESACAALICATSPVLLYFATQTLSEPFFGLLLVCGLWSTEAALQSPGMIRRRIAFLQGGTIALTFLTRVVAAPIIAVTSILVLRRQRNVWFVIGAGCCASLWLLWIMSHSVSRPQSEAEAYYTVAPYLSWWSQGSSALSVPGWNSLSLLTSTIAVPLPSLKPVGPHGLWLGLVLGLATWACIIAGRLSMPALVGSLTSYVSLILFWPWPPARFLVPWAPLFVVFAVRGINRASLVLPRAPRTLLLLLVMSAATLSNAVLLRESVTSTQDSGYPRFPGTGGSLPRWTNFQTLFDWLRNNSSTHDVLASGLDTMLFLYTDRQAIRPFEPRPSVLFYGGSSHPIGTVEDFVESLRRHRVGYFVQVPMHSFAEEQPLNRLLTDTQRALPGCLREVYRVPSDPRFAVLAVDAQACVHQTRQSPTG